MLQVAPADDRIDNRHGFTIVELLIVVVIIAILAAITIVAYNGIQQRARASSATSALSQAKKKLELYKVDNPAYPATGSLAAAGGTDTSDVSFQYTSTGTTYCLTATNGNVSYTATDTTQPTQGGCAGHGQGGVGAVTNLVTNPSFETSVTANSNVNQPSFVSRTLVTGGFTGTYASRLTITNPSASLSGLGLYTQVSGLVPEKSYTASVWMRVSRSMPYMIYLERRNDASVNIGAIASPVTALSPNTWTRLTLSIPPTPTMTRLTFCAYSFSANVAVGDAIEFDGLMVTEREGALLYADGSSPNWVWNGTPNASTSTGPPL